MNKSTQNKIASAINKLGDVSYRKIATEAGVSVNTVQRYRAKSTPEESTPIKVRAESTPPATWDGRLRPLLSMIGYLSSPNSPLSEGKPLARVPDYSMGKRG